MTDFFWLLAGLAGVSALAVLGFQAWSARRRRREHERERWRHRGAAQDLPRAAEQRAGIDPAARPH